MGHTGVGGMGWIMVEPFRFTCDPYNSLQAEKSVYENIWRRLPFENGGAHVVLKGSFSKFAIRCRNTGIKKPFSAKQREKQLQLKRERKKTRENGTVMAEVSS